MPSLPQPLAALLAIFASLVQRRQEDVVAYLMEENRLLREQLDGVLGGRRLRLTDDQRRRLAVRGRVLGRKTLAEVASIAVADTILRWHRQLVGTKYGGSKRRGAGRPPTPKSIADLAVRMARENPWGYTRIRDALGGVGHKIGRSTVRRILKNHGVAPAPERRRRTSWKVFLAAHWVALEGAVSFEACGTGARKLVLDAGHAVARSTTRWIDTLDRHRQHRGGNRGFVAGSDRRAGLQRHQAVRVAGQRRGLRAALPLHEDASSGRISVWSGAGGVPSDTA